MHTGTIPGVCGPVRLYETILIGVVPMHAEDGISKARDKIMDSCWRGGTYQ